MELTENHYKDAIKTKDWMKLDEDQQTILALQTEMQAVKAKTRQQMQNKDRRLKNKKEKFRDKKKPGTGEGAWKKRAPKPGEAQTKTHSGKTYTWCPYHEL
jgi:hypothetical protein